MSKHVFKAVRPHDVHKRLSENYENDYDYQEYNDMKPVASITSLNTRDAEYEEYRDNVCRQSISVDCFHPK